MKTKISGETSDGYHTFNELYDHRVLLWINFCLMNIDKCYLVPNHFEGWFLLGMKTSWGQISYHCPNKYYGMIEKVKIEHPEFDGHTSKEVIERLECLAVFNRNGTQQSKLVPLDVIVVLNALDKDWQKNHHPYSLKRHESYDLVKYIISFICSNFGSPAVPSLEEIENIVHKYMTTPRTVEKTIKDFYTNSSKELATAIHRLLTNGKEEK